MRSITANQLRRPGHATEFAELVAAAAAFAEYAHELSPEARRTFASPGQFEKVSARQLHDQFPARRGPLPPNLIWQSQTPAPTAMPGAAIDRLLFETFPARTANRLKRLACPAIGLWPQRPPNNVPAWSSRLGGIPSTPSAWSWPMVGSEPMLFIGQVNCSELSSLPGAEKLPPSGLLAFFADHDGVMACDFAARENAVFHWPNVTDLQQATPPIDLAYVLPICALAFRPLVELPDPYSRVVEAILTDPEEVTRYAKIVDAVRHHGIPD